MLGRTACRRERPLQLLGAASISPAPVPPLGHVLTCTSPVLSLRISLMGNPVHSALLPASGVAREGGAGSRALTREAPVATGTVCTLCCNWSVFPLLLGAWRFSRLWAGYSLDHCLPLHLHSVPKEG